jgi:hypothetical protein
MVSSKILWNSVISTKNARFAGADIKNMYLETPLDRYEYMKMPIALFPTDIIEHYRLKEKVLVATSTWKSERVCTDCHKPASLPTNY